jgi:hypothetical protein
MSLQKSLPRIAARVLHNTHVGLSRMKEKFELIEEAYGRAAVEADFTLWCQEQMAASNNPKYPLTEYVKVVDSRLGPEFAEKRPDTKDPQVSEISAVAYELTGVLPSVRSVATLLASCPAEEIIAALREFAKTLDEKDTKSGVRTFFAEGGAAAVILARRRRAKPVVGGPTNLFGIPSACTCTEATTHDDPLHQRTMCSKGKQNAS